MTREDYQQAQGYIPHSPQPLFQKTEVSIQWVRRDRENPFSRFYAQNYQEKVARRKVWGFIDAHG
jgi:hypothetical protein